MAKKKSSIAVNTLVLVAVTFVAIFALALVNQITSEPIKQAEIAARAEIYKSVYPNAAEFAEIENTQELLDASASMLSSNGLDGCTVNDVLAVTNASGEAEGYVIAATCPEGYGGDIQVAIGIKGGVLTGFDVVSNSETAGLGSKCTEPEFKSQFAGKPAALLEYTKTGASADNEIDAISGATITTNAVTKAANAAILFYQTNFADGADGSAVKGE
ncbi:MAG: RnfABCDGE type electron transport complex subunit G [Eubacterium sp.]